MKMNLMKPMKNELTLETREIAVWDDSIKSMPKLLFTIKVKINHVEKDLIIDNIEIKYHKEVFVPTAIPKVRDILG